MTYDSLRKEAAMRFDGQHVAALRQMGYSTQHLIEGMIQGTLPHGIVVGKPKLG
jgi:hypothetical protein